MVQPAEDFGRGGHDEQADESKWLARAGDGVSSIIISSNDFAGAWATRGDGQAMLRLSGNAMFASGGVDVNDRQLPLLHKITAALNQVPGTTARVRLSAQRSYSFTVAAVDKAGYLSPQAKPVRIATGRTVRSASW